MKALQIIRRFGLLLAVVIIATPVQILAITPQNKQSLLGNSEYYWSDQAKTVCSSTSASSSVTTPGTVYVVGDSIGTQFVPGLQAALSSSGSTGWTVPQTGTPNVLASRQLSDGGPSPNGLQTVNADQAAMANATAVIVELGTNSGGLNAANISTMITKIKQYAPTAHIFWINTATSGTPAASLPATLGNVNGIIASQAATLGYQVISWNNEVFGSQADPTVINPSAPDNGYIRQADEYVHLTDAGKTAMTNLIVSTLTGNAASSGTAATGSSCACTTGSTPLTGAENPDKIWNYFRNKGLTPIQVAGLMGNLQAEGGFDPLRVQYGHINSRGEISEAGKPSSEDDTMVIDGSTGYGIAQWTAKNRQQALHDMAVGRGVKDGDLATQLDFLWQELTTSYNDSTYVPLSQTADLRTATQIVLHNFEGPKVENLDERFGFAQAILSQFGSGTPGSGGATTSSSGCGGSASANVNAIVQDALLFSWPDNRGLTPKPEYAAAVAQYDPESNNAGFWFGADCGTFVATVMRASGADPNYPHAGTPGQEDYVRAHPELYDVVDSTSVNDLQPGDILIVNGAQGGGGADGHTFIFVGNQPPNNYGQASASGGDRMANLEPIPTDANGIVNDSRGNYLRARLKQ